MVTTVVPKISTPVVGHVTAGHTAIPASEANSPAGLKLAPRGPLAQVSGEAHSRFVIVTTLLSLIDPVRGEATTHSLDRHPHDDSLRQAQLHKKFLDSFALISSTSRKGGDTASAVCLEQGHPSGNILRLARNHGISQELVNRLQEILEYLTTVALRERKPKEVEDEILRKVIELTKDKIQSLLKKLDCIEVRASIQQATDKMVEEDSLLDDSENPGFKQWVRDLPLLVSNHSNCEPSKLVCHIKWASRAKWVFSEQLEVLFGFEDSKAPPWLKYIYKLGRYYAATKAMLKLAVKEPHVFTAIHIEPVRAPEPQIFSLGQQKTPLLTVLKKITKADPNHLMEKLGQTWLTGNPEKRLRDACQMTLTVHAEMQLLSFYDHNPHLTPRLLFMGTSKKTCYLCHEFMSRHPLTIGWSASHQKLYPTWMPAPCSSAVRKRHKSLLWEFSRHLEQTTARDLETRLGMPRRPFNLDSTAGPSLTTTGTVSTGFWYQNLPLSVRNGSEKASFEESDRE